MDEPVFDRETTRGLETIARTLGWSVAQVLALAVRLHPGLPTDQAAGLLILDHYQRRLPSPTHPDYPLPEDDVDHGPGLRDQDDGDNGHGGEDGSGPASSSPLARALKALRDPPKGS